MTAEGFEMTSDGAKKVCLAGRLAVIPSTARNLSLSDEEDRRVNWGDFYGG